MLHRTGWTWCSWQNISFYTTPPNSLCFPTKSQACLSLAKGCILGENFSVNRSPIYRFFFRKHLSPPFLVLVFLVYILRSTTLTRNIMTFFTLILNPKVANISVRSGTWYQQEFRPCVDFTWYKISLRSSKKEEKGHNRTEQFVSYNCCSVIYCCRGLPPVRIRHFAPFWTENKTSIGLQPWRPKRSLYFRPAWYEKW